MITPSTHRLPRRFRIGAGKFFLVAAAVCFSTLHGSAQTVEMTKIVYQRVDSAVKPDSVDAKPRTLYRAGEKYLRVEEAPTPGAKVHMLRITREPEAWAINLVDHTARHFLDPGPTFNARAPIFWSPKPAGEPDPDKQFVGLEFGNEQAFFRQFHATETASRKIEGKDCQALTVKTQTREVTLLFDPETGKPVQIESTKDGKPDFVVRYVSYETGLSFDPSLFEPPEGLKITEAQ